MVGLWDGGVPTGDLRWRPSNRRSERNARSLVSASLAFETTEFIRLSKTIRTHREGILASIRLGVSNGRVEGLNTKVRSIIARSEGVSLRQGCPGPGDASLWTD